MKEEKIKVKSEIPEWQKELVMTGRANTKATDYLDWEAVRVKLDAILQTSSKPKY